MPFYMFGITKRVRFHWVLGDDGCSRSGYEATVNYLHIALGYLLFDWGSLRSGFLPDFFVCINRSPPKLVAKYQVKVKCRVSCGTEWNEEGMRFLGPLLVMVSILELESQSEVCT